MHSRRSIRELVLRVADFACSEHRKFLNTGEVERDILNFLGGTE